MRVLVTGALGSVGVWVVQRLLDEGHEVVALDLRTDHANRPSLEGAVPFRQADVLDTAGLVAILSGDRIECICHTAAWVTAPNVPVDTDPYRGFATNGMGVVSVLEAARLAGVGRVVCASTKAIYAPFVPPFAAPTYAPVPEDYPKVAAATSRSYEASKIFGEEAGQYYADRFEITYRACRFGTIVRAGKDDLGGSFAAAYASAVAAALRGETYFRSVVTGARDDLTYVKDVAQGLVLACLAEQATSRFFNIATGVVSSFEDWVEAIRSVLPDAKVELELLPPAVESQSSQCCLDIQRASDELGYAPEFDLTDAVADLVERFAERGL